MWWPVVRRLASASRSLDKTRQMFQQSRDTGNLFDTVRWTRALEQGVRIAWDVREFTARTFHSIPAARV